jgi:hypothetical protein
MRTATWILSIAAAASLGAAAPGRQPGPVEPGWRARWGMTADEVLAAYRDEARPIAPKGTRVQALAELDGLTLAGRESRAVFWFELGRLAAVNLQPVLGGDLGERDFEQLKQALTVRFGKPTTDMVRRDLGLGTFVAQWFLPEVLVELSLVPGSERPLLLRYEAPRPPPTAAP